MKLKILYLFFYIFIFSIQSITAEINSYPRLTIDNKTENNDSIKQILINHPEVKEIIFKNFNNLTIPNEINNLNNLESIEFDNNNNLDLGIIFRLLSCNRNIKYLRFLGNNIDSIPSEISLMQSLIDLDLRNEKKIVYFSEEAADKTNLKEISIGDHDLLRLPKNLEKYESIETIHFSQICRFDIKETFNRISRMKNLKVLWITNFQPDTIVEYFPILQDICVLHLSDIRMEVLPSTFLQMKSLECLDISYSNIRYLDEEYFKAEKKLTISILTNQEILDEIKKELKNTNIKLLRYWGYDTKNCY